MRNRDFTAWYGVEIPDVGYPKPRVPSVRTPMAEKGCVSLVALLCAIFCFEMPKWQPDL